MAPARLIDDISWSSPAFVPEPYEGPPRNVKSIDEIKFNESVKFPKYEILGTDPDSKILFLDVNILDCTGQEPFKGDVYIEGKCLRSSIIETNFRLLMIMQRRANQGSWRSRQQGRTAQES